MLWTVQPDGVSAGHAEALGNNDRGFRQDYVLTGPERRKEDGPEAALLAVEAALAAGGRTACGSVVKHDGVVVPLWGCGPGRSVLDFTYGELVAVWQDAVEPKP